MWHNLVGTLATFSGTSGTVTPRAGSVLLQIVVHASVAGATLSIFGGPAIPIINGAAPLVLQNYHTLQKADASNSGTIVFTNTDSYYVQCLVEGNY
jgi:hypothetical protein